MSGPHGVTDTGFVLKTFPEIMEDKLARLREMFGAEVDLAPTSPLRKLAEITSFEDQELWKAAERQYYAGSISTASGPDLDLLGEEIGLTRRFLPARGTVTIELMDPAPARTYRVPPGALVAGPAADGPVVLRTEAGATLSEQVPAAVVPVVSLGRGPAQNLAAETIAGLHPDYLPRLQLGSASIVVTNPDPISGGDAREDDALYRDRLIGWPRTVWTLEAVRAAVKDVDGVRDCRLSDANGGIDLALGYFGDFTFGARPFAPPRTLGSPYFFDVLVALEPGVLFEDVGPVAGVLSRVRAAIDPVRPVSVFPNILRASHIRVGARGRILIGAGHDPAAVLAALQDGLARRINALGLGRTVRFADVLVDMKSVTGVLDVQDLQLRRRPGQFGRIQFGDRRDLAGADVELPIGANLRLESDEIAEFALDSELLELMLEQSS